MGADLIGAAFTTDCTMEPGLSLSRIADHIRAIPADTLMGEEFLAVIDPQGRWDGEANAEAVRDALISGATEYHAAVLGHRYSIGIPIPGTSLMLHFAGGESYGDDPFEGFHDLCVFVDAVPALGLPVEDTGLVCGGLPDPTTALRYRTDAA